MQAFDKRQLIKERDIALLCTPIEDSHISLVLAYKNDENGYLSY